MKKLTPKQRGPQTVRTITSTVVSACSSSLCPSASPLTDIASATYHKEFRKSPRYQRIVRFDPSMPSDKYRKLTATLSKRHTSILTQLRTNHVPLQFYLHRFKLADSPVCPQCNEHPETVTHYLFHCRKYAKQRAQLKKDLKPGTRLDLRILGDKKNLTALFKFIKASNRFDEDQGEPIPAGATSHAPHPR